MFTSLDRLTTNVSYHHMDSTMLATPKHFRKGYPSHGDKTIFVNGDFLEPMFGQIDSKKINTSLLNELMATQIARNIRWLRRKIISRAFWKIRSFKIRTKDVKHLLVSILTVAGCAVRRVQGHGVMRIVEQAARRMSMDACYKAGATRLVGSLARCAYTKLMQRVKRLSKNAAAVWSCKESAAQKIARVAARHDMRLSHACFNGIKSTLTDVHIRNICMQ
jgi:hypothetical protein